MPIEQAAQAARLAPQVKLQTEQGSATANCVCAPLAPSKVRSLVIAFFVDKGRAAEASVPAQKCWQATTWLRHRSGASELSCASSRSFAQAALSALVPRGAPTWDATSVRVAWHLAEAELVVLAETATDGRLFCFAS